MKPTCLLFGAVLLIGGSIAAPAAVKESDFPPRTVRDLIEICSPDQNDPMMNAAAPASVRLQGSPAALSTIK